MDKIDVSDKSFLLQTKENIANDHKRASIFSIINKDFRIKKIYSRFIEQAQKKKGSKSK